MNGRIKKLLQAYAVEPSLQQDSLYCIRENKIEVFQILSARLVSMPLASPVLGFLLIWDVESRDARCLSLSRNECGRCHVAANCSSSSLFWHCRAMVLGSCRRSSMTAAMLLSDQDCHTNGSYPRRSPARRSVLCSSLLMLDPIGSIYAIF
jgi:hypothetical protein